MNRIPSMGGNAIADALREAASLVPDGHSIVEVGTWLGAGTYHLIQGAKPDCTIDVHCYDRFVANSSEVTKAAATGLELKPGQNTRPIVAKHLAGLHIIPQLHRCSIKEAKWYGNSIGLYVDDAAKQTENFLHVLRTFGPFWVPEVTTVILMDYHFWRKMPKRPDLQCQKRFIEKYEGCFTPLRDLGLNGAMFRYERWIDFKQLRKHHME
jgi:hypothetical protein